METDACRACRELLGPYVLGHLDTDGVGRVEAHLATCATCADDAAAIAPVAAALPPRGSTPPVGPSLHDLEEQVVRLAERRRGRPRQLAAVAALLLVVGVGVGVAGLQSGPDQGLGIREPVAATTTAPGVAVTEAAVMPHTWGTEVFLTVDGLEEDVRYELILRTAAGGEESAGTLIGDAARPVVCIMNGAELREDVVAFELRRRDDGAAIVVGDLQPYAPEEA